MQEILQQLPNALAGLREVCPNANEFHFTDIYSSKADFADVDLQVRLAVFRFMAWVFSTYNFPVFVQTLDPENTKDLHARAQWPENVGPLKSSNHEDFALLLLLIRVRLHLKEAFGQAASARVFVDEGRLKNGASISLPGFAPLFRDGMVSFADSKAISPLQLADFAAFSMNRMQLLRVKDTLSPLDKQLLEILSPMAPCFQNLQMVQVHDLATIKNFTEGVVGGDG